MTDVSPFPSDVLDSAAAVLDRARQAGLRLAAAESCTGGLIAAALTDIAGCSDVVEGGAVTYSNTLKQTVLGVPEPLLRESGAVSKPVARAMAQGAVARLKADVAVAVTGIAGPGGGTADKPVGLVWIATARKGRATVAREHRFGDIGRTRVRMETVRAALRMLDAALDQAAP